MREAMNLKTRCCRVITLFLYKKFIPIVISLFLADRKKIDTCFLKNKPCEPLSKIPELKVINKTISDIPDDKFRVSFGLYLSGYDYEEIAVIMNLSLHEVEYSIRFVKEKLSSGR